MCVEAVEFARLGLRYYGSFAMCSFCRWCVRRTTLPFALIVIFVTTACESVLSVKYEYDEEIYLELDGSATMYVNA